MVEQGYTTYALVCFSNVNKVIESIAIYKTHDAAITGLLGPDWKTRAIGKYVQKKENDTQVFKTNVDTWYVIPVKTFLGAP